MSDGQSNVNVVPDGGDDGPRWSRGGPPWDNRPRWWEQAITTLVWTLCTLLILGFVVWGLLFLFDHVVNVLHP